MGKILAKTVAVWDPELGKRIKFHPGDELPEQYEEKVTNPALFADMSHLDPESGEEQPANENWHKGLTIPKLQKIALDEEIDIEGWKKKSDLIEMIEAARAAKGDDEPDEEEQFT